MEDNNVTLTVTSGIVRRHVTTLQVFKPVEGASNVVFNLTRPVVLYKKAEDSDESLPTETKEVKVWLRDIRNAVNEGNIPYLSVLQS